MEYLSLQPGPVTGVLLVCVRFLLAPGAIFHALHTVKSLATAPITYIVNSARNAQLLVRCTNPIDALRVSYTRAMLKFDDKLIKCINLESISLLPYDEDGALSKEFLACQEDIPLLNYPRGYGSSMEDMDLHYYPTMSATTVDILVVGPEHNAVKFLLENLIISKKSNYFFP
jgi:hypothetical protein